MRDFYPPIEPYDSGMLDVGDGNQVYWETSGDPHGKPVAREPRPGVPENGGVVS